MEPVEYERMAAVEDSHWWWRARREIVARTLERFAPEVVGRPRRIVEVGCGTGGNLEMLAGFGEVLGAEHEPAAVEHARRRYGSRFEILRHGIPEPLPKTFDVLAMLDVLEHIEDDAGALVWVKEQLEPGGVAIVTVPAFEFMWSDMDEALHHFRRYNPASLRALVPDGLEVAHLTCYNSLLFAPIAGVRLAQHLLPERKRAGGEQLDLPPPFLNALLYRFFRSERHVVPRLHMPLGVSVLLVARRTAP